MRFPRAIFPALLVVLLVCASGVAVQTVKPSAQVSGQTAKPAVPAPDNLFAEGYSLLEAGDAQAAAAKFEAGLKTSPQNPLAHFFLGKSYYTLEKYDLAKAHLEKSLELDPTNKYAADAKMLLQTMAEAEAHQAAENTLWASAESSKNKSYYQSYLQQYPKGKHAAEAQGALASIASEEAQKAASAAAQAEEAAWASSQQGERSGSARAYLQQYPNGKYAAAAKARLAVIEQTSRHALDNLPFVWDEASLALLKDSGVFQDWPRSAAAGVTTSSTTNDIVRAGRSVTETNLQTTQSTAILGPGISEVQTVFSVDSPGKNPLFYTSTSRSFVVLGGLLPMQNDQYSDLGTLDKHSNWSHKAKFSGDYDTHTVFRLTGIHGTLFPLGSGATLTIDSTGEGGRQTDNSAYSTSTRTSCKTLEKVAAKSLSPEFSGNAFKMECTTSMRTKTNSADTTFEYISHDYFLESLGFRASAIGAQAKSVVNGQTVESTTFYPAAGGESGSDTDGNGTTTTKRYSAVKIEVRSNAGTDGGPIISTPSQPAPQADSAPPKPEDGAAAAPPRPALAARPKSQH